eukprot:661859-Pyramimonas_sp.AAC.1
MCSGTRFMGSTVDTRYFLDITDAGYMCRPKSTCLKGNRSMSKVALRRRGGRCVSSKSPNSKRCRLWA